MADNESTRVQKSQAEGSRGKRAEGGEMERARGESGGKGRLLKLEGNWERRRRGKGRGREKATV
jgi:hypothetical protein